MCPLSNGKDSFRQLDTVLNQCKTNMLNPPRKITLLGNVDGSYTLPLFYIDAFIDKYGAGSVYDVICDPLKILTELEIASNLLNYSILDFVFLKIKTLILVAAFVQMER